MKNNHEMGKKPTAKKQAIQVHPEHTERCKATRKTNQKKENSVITNTKHVQATCCHFIAQLCLLQKGQGAVICHHCPACGCYWPLFKTTTLEVSHMKFNKNNPTVPKNNHRDEKRNTCWASLLFKVGAEQSEGSSGARGGRGALLTRFHRSLRSSLVVVWDSCRHAEL